MAPAHQPAGQGIAAQVFLHHEMGATVGGEAVEPAAEQVVQCTLADADRWVGEDAVEPKLVGDVVRVDHVDPVRHSGVRGVGRRELTGPGVDIDGPYDGGGGPERGDDGDGTPSAPEIEHGAIGVGEGRCLEQQELGAGVETVTGEHPAVGGHGERSVGQGDLDTPRRGGHVGVGLEVLPGTGFGVGRGGHGDDGSLVRMAAYEIRIIGDPVLRQKARDITDIDSSLVRLVDDMLDTMYAAPGIGLAAPQVGVQKRLFVWDIGDGPQAIVNPEIVDADGEWVFEEGCLSVPGLSWEITRPKTVHVVGRDLDGNEMSFEADEIEARMFQHELDHLDGTLLVERLDPDTRKAALAAIRDAQLRSIGSDASSPGVETAGGTGLRLP